MNIKQAIEIIKWLVRLPLAFSISFTALCGLWLVMGYGYVVGMPMYGDMEEFLRKTLTPDGTGNILAVGVLVNSIINILVILFGVFLAYNAAVGINWLVFKAGALLGYPKKFRDYVPSTQVKQKRNGKRKIGIILAGGGAKGSFQAGAMRAIHEYLERYDALGDVCMIAGTSIGSWNSMFWLADLVKADASGESFHQKWWSEINARAVINPDFYVPFMRNSIFTTDPWEVQFDRIFAENKKVRKRIIETKVRFYLTRTNVGSGKLEFVTNNPGDKGGIPMVPFNTRSPDEYQNKKYIEKNLFKIASKKDAPAYLQTLKDGVFSSMDLPPLFPYRKIVDEYFEDGGVIDNLPVSFGVEVENCDLLFVVPLNSDFEEDVNTNSIITRLNRVMTVRQGALERNSLHLVDLYNSAVQIRAGFLDALEWGYGSKGGGKGKSKKKAKAKEFYYYDDPWWEGWTDDDVEQFYKQDGENFKKRTRVFAVCPGKPLVIDTAEFWKTEAAAEAFNLMYEATRDLLDEKDPLREEFTYDDKAVVLHLVSRYKNVTEDRDI